MNNVVSFMEERPKRNNLILTSLRYNRYLKKNLFDTVLAQTSV